MPATPRTCPPRRRRRPPVAPPPSCRAPFAAARRVTRGPHCCRTPHGQASVPLGRRLRRRPPGRGRTAPWQAARRSSRRQDATRTSSAAAPANGSRAPSATAIHRSVVTNASQPPPSASRKPGSSSSGPSPSSSPARRAQGDGRERVRSFSDACWASSDSRSACRLLSSPSRVTTSVSFSAWSISSRTRATLARCVAIRLSTSTTCPVTSFAFDVRDSSFPEPARSRQDRVVPVLRHPQDEHGTCRGVSSTRSVVSSADDAARRPPRRVRAAATAFGTLFTSIESVAVRMTWTATVSPAPVPRRPPSAGFAAASAPAPASARRRRLVVARGLHFPRAAVAGGAARAGGR